MKIVIESGGDGEPPSGHNTRIFIDGKEPQNITHFFFEVQAGCLADWGMSWLYNNERKSYNATALVPLQRPADPFEGLFHGTERQTTLEKWL